MEKSITSIKVAITGLLGMLTALWGWFGWLVIIWIFAMLLDWLSGSWAATRNNDWNSKRGHEGLSSKGAMILVVVVAAVADFVIGTLINSFDFIKLPFTYSVLLCPLVITWYLLTELGSITENAIILGAPCPEFLKKILKMLKSTLESTGNKMVGDTEDEPKGKINPDT